MYIFSKTENNGFLKTFLMKFAVKIYEKYMSRSSCLVKLQAFRLQSLLIINFFICIFNDFDCGCSCTFPIRCVKKQPTTKLY